MPEGPLFDFTLAVDFASTCGVLRSSPDTKQEKIMLPWIVFVVLGDDAGQVVAPV